MSKRRNDDRPGLSDLKTSPFQRNMALTRLGFGAGTQLVRHSFRNMFRDESQREAANREFFAEQARELADRLGELKGTVMKAGQMMSLYGQYFLPEEAVAALSELHDDSPPVQWPVIERTLRESLGPQRLAELDINPVSLGAASLGQVHRARRRGDDRELVVKVQYPGVAESIDSDLKTLSRLLLMSKLTPKGLDMNPIFAELREMLRQEVDYVAERRDTELFSQRLADDPRYRVPDCLADLSTDRVLTMTYEVGVSPRHPSVAALPQARRDALGASFFDLFLKEFFEWGVVQTDPHFGNYRVQAEDSDEPDRLVLLDFGATRRFSQRFVDAYSDLISSAIDDDIERVIDANIRIGLLKPEFPRPLLEGFAQLCCLIVEPFRPIDDPRIPAHCRTADHRYDWAASDLMLRASQMAARQALSLHFQIPPREIVFLHRRLLGVFATLAELRCQLNLRERLLSVLKARNAA